MGPIFESGEDTDSIIERGEEVPTSSKKRGGNDYFLMRKRGLVRNPDYRKLMKGPGTIYEHIWSNIVRDKMYNDKHNVKENYYNNGFLAYASTHRHIAKKCFMSVGMVIDHVEEFEQAGIMKTQKIGPAPTKRDVRGRLIDRRKTVFILGTWQKEVINGKEKIKERYYIDDVFYE